MATGSTAFFGVTEDFYGFVEEVVVKPETARFESVEEYIELWVHSHRAWHDCAHDVQIYLVAVSLILADWFDARAKWKDESEWDLWIPIRISKAFKNQDRTRGGSYQVPEILDPFLFQYWSV